MITNDELERICNMRVHSFNIDALLAQYLTENTEENPEKF